MNKIYQYILATVLPMVVATAVGVAYKFTNCYFLDISSNAKFICEFKWKDGFIFLCSYVVIKLISPFFKWKSVEKQILLSLGLYSVFYAAYAFPFWVASLFHPLQTNVLIHAIILILFVEIATRALSNKINKAPYSASI